MRCWGASLRRDVRGWFVGSVSDESGYGAVPQPCGDAVCEFCAGGDAGVSEVVKPPFSGATNKPDGASAPGARIGVGGVHFLRERGGKEIDHEVEEGSPGASRVTK